MQRFSTDASVSATAVILIFVVWPILSLGVLIVGWTTLMWVQQTPRGAFFPGDPFSTMTIFFGSPVVAGLLCYGVFWLIAGTNREERTPGDLRQALACVGVAAVLAISFWIWLVCVAS
jgi:nitrate reductase NapE component